jgi:hypothetical protein
MNPWSVVAQQRSYRKPDKNSVNSAMQWRRDITRQRFDSGSRSPSFCSMEIRDTLKALSIFVNPLFINQPLVSRSHKFVDSTLQADWKYQGIGGNMSRNFNLLSLNTHIRPSVYVANIICKEHGPYDNMRSTCQLLAKHKRLTSTDQDFRWDTWWEIYTIYNKC